jgi:hypothetical protein
LRNPHRAAEAMETDPINPASSDSSPSMEIKSTDPIESGVPAADLTTSDSAATDSAAADLEAVKPVTATAATPIAPEPVKTQEPVVASIPTPAASEAIAERIQVAATTSSSADDNSSEGGEWDLLSSKVRQWWDDNNLVDLWQRSRRPLFLIVGLIGLTLLIRIYSGILAAIGSIPLAPRLFELVGLGWVIWFSVTKLIRSEERKALLANVGGIWSAFKGSVRP